MSRFKCSAAQLHTPLFLNGSNLGDKLSARARTGLDLEYDTDLAVLVVQYQRGGCIVPSSNVASATPMDLADLGIDPSAAASAPQAPTQRALPPTAPQPGHTPPMARPQHAMAPQIQQRTAQVSHPIRDAVNANGHPVAPRKYMPHSTLDVNRAAMLAASGAVQPGAAAPTTADLQAIGKLPPPLTIPQDFGAQEPSAPAAAPRQRKPKAPKVEAE